MEGIKSLISTSNSLQPDQSVDTFEARFVDLCKNGLKLDENTNRLSMVLFKETIHLLANMSNTGTGTTSEEVQRYWFAFILYSVKRLTVGSSDKAKRETLENGLNLCQILRATKLNLVDFFKELPQFILRVGPVLRNLYGADWENRLEAREMQANFVHLSLLSKYYRRAFQEFFLGNEADDNSQQVSVSTIEHVSDYYRFGWLLFLALRIHAFSRFKDLVTCTNGLVSVMAILILHVPISFRKFSILETQRFVKKDSNQVDLITSLCNIYSTSEDELRRTLEKANNLIIDLLKKKPRLASECHTENLENIDTAGLIYFEDLMDESSLSSSLIILEEDYSNAIQSNGDLDERVFINDEDSLYGSGSLSGGAVNKPGCKRKFDAIVSPTKTIKSSPSPRCTPASPTNGNLSANSCMAPTPVSTAMTTAKWLRTVISPLPSKPSTELEHFLLSCDKVLVDDVIRGANVILEAIFPCSAIEQGCVAGRMHGANLIDNEWVKQRRTEALKLYYRVMEAMCKAETQRLHDNNLTLLLGNERFHRCMLACSAELVLATHKTVTLLFPRVLERTGITAFDLSKVIESFIRHEPSLPRELRRHLNFLEERLLESMVWEKGSSLYNSLAVARPALSSEINRLELLAESMPSLDEIIVRGSISSRSMPSPCLHKEETLSGLHGDIRSPKRVCGGYGITVDDFSFMSPVKDRVSASKHLKSKLLSPPLQSVFSSPSRRAPGGDETCAETVINVFLSKILKLAAVRINGLIERLQLPQYVRETVYRLVQQILSQQTALFFNRHIDQIILCSLYGVCKISNLSLTFREIIYNYRKQPHCKPQVFRSVYVDWSSIQCSRKTGQDHVDIITFYNEVFIPTIKHLLAELGPVGAGKKTNKPHEINSNSDGQCAGSPKLTPFPSLPDISPKKVTRAHNIYVSPLRSPKMGTLNTQGCRSYYACVGESTHAYQSPSKDLAAINNCLNSKKVNSRLNFDDLGVARDSPVVGTLYNGDGSCNSSSDPAILTPRTSERRNSSSSSAVADLKSPLKDEKF